MKWKQFRKILAKDYQLRPSIKELLKEEIIQKTMKEFADTKGTNIKNFTFVETEINSNQENEIKKNTITFNNNEKNTHMVMGSTVMSQDFNIETSKKKQTLSSNTNKKVKNNIIFCY